MKNETGKAANTAENVEKQMGRGLKLFVCIVLGLALFLAVINIIPPKKVMADNPFLKEEGGLPMIAAHRGGGISNPENTLMAYRAAVNEYHIQICETDLWMTLDGHLVYSHDESINRMACPEDAEPVIIAEHTVGEEKSPFELALEAGDWDLALVGFSLALDCDPSPYLKEGGAGNFSNCGDAELTQWINAMLIADTDKPASDTPVNEG